MRKLTPKDLPELLTPAERDDLLAHLLDDGPANYRWLSPGTATWNRLVWGHGMPLKVKQAFKKAAAKVAYQRRIQLALAVSILCGVCPGNAALLARRQDVDLTAREWTVRSADIRPAKRRPETRRKTTEKFSIPPRAVTAFYDAENIRDGWALLLRIVPRAKCHLARNGGVLAIERPHLPSPPKRQDLVFPSSGHTPRTPIPKHVFHYYLSNWYCLLR